MPSWDVSGGGYANIEGYSIPTYVAKSSDPVRKVHDRALGGKVVDTIRVPDSAREAWGTDGHLNIIDETHRWVSEMFAVQRLPSGDLSTLGYLKNDLRGPGGGFDYYHGTIAAGMSSLGGMIRKGELVNGTAGLRTGIRHALQGIVYPKGLNRNVPGGTPCVYPNPCRSWVWPASSSDPPWGYDTIGNVYMGSLLAIPPWVNIHNLGITDPQAFEVARALQDYGLYVVDTGGVPSNQIVIRIDPQAETDLRDRKAFEKDLSIALSQLWVVANSHASGRAPSTPGGGGQPRRQLAPPFRIRS